jgi:hypothetical protein
MTDRPVVSAPTDETARERIDELADRLAIALTWAPKRPGRGGFEDGMDAMDDLLALARREARDDG